MTRRGQRGGRRRGSWAWLGWAILAGCGAGVRAADAPGPSAGVRAIRLEVPAGPGEGFTLLDPAALGIAFTHALPAARKREWQNLMNGSGLAAGDIDHDGRVDLYLCHRSGPNALFRNLGGGRFVESTAAAGVACTHLSSSGAVFADLDGDGHLDLLVSSFGGPHACFRGDGRGGFREVTAATGITSQAGGTSMALGDLDGDGDLDLYWCNFGTLSPLRDGVQLSERMINGVPTVTGRWARKVRILGGRYWEFGDPDVLYRNEGGGRFVAVPFEAAFLDEEGRPVETPWDFGLAVQVRDLNGDGHPDVYVCNDFQTPDRMWLGDGRGRFRAAPRGALRNMSYASMGVDFADLDRDGRLDFLTVEMLNRDHGRFLRTLSPREPHLRVPGPGEDREEFTRNALYWNRGDGTWAEIACFAGVAATDWSWTPLFLDVDLDGWEDLLVSNGHLHDVNDRDVNAGLKGGRATGMRGNRDTLDRYPPQAVAKAAYRNRRDLTFEDAAARWRFDSPRIAHGMIAADLDEDGDLDVVLNCLDGPPLVYRNDCPAPRVAVRLRGRAPNTGAVGARVTLRGGPVVQFQEVLAGGPYLSGSDPRRVYA
ncbi:MAG: CRTAC1 family protein, partial [Verrucomicrobiota bacterium]